MSNLLDNPAKYILTNLFESVPEPEKDAFLSHVVGNFPLLEGVRRDRAIHVVESFAAPIALDLDLSTLGQLKNLLSSSTNPVNLGDKQAGCRASWVVNLVELFSQALGRHYDLSKFYSHFVPKAERELTKEEFPRLYLLVRRLMEDVAKTKPVLDRAAFVRAYELVRGRTGDLRFEGDLSDKEELGITDDDCRIRDNLESAAYYMSIAKAAYETHPDFVNTDGTARGDRPYIAVKDTSEYGTVLIVATLKGQDKDEQGVYASGKISFSGEGETMVDRLEHPEYGCVFSGRVDDDGDQRVAVFRYKEGASGKYWVHDKADEQDRLCFHFILRDGGVVRVARKVKEAHQAQLRSKVKGTVVESKPKPKPKSNVLVFNFRARKVEDNLDLDLDQTSEPR